MKSGRRLLLCLLLIAGCEDDDGIKNLEPTVLLISMDGFRWDYLERTETPNLDYLVANGVKAESLVPVYPSSTFPNHYTIATGLYPENHGIVSNGMYDPEFDAFFYIGSGSEPARDGRWYEGEPIWVTAEKQEQTAMTMFWPGSDAEILGIRPTEYRQYDGSVKNRERVQQILTWLDLPKRKRPTFMTLYFSDTDSYGHNYGPDAPEMEIAIKEMDDQMGRLITGLDEVELLDQVNIIITSDHGMARTSSARLIMIDDHISLKDVIMTGWGAYGGIWPNDGLEETIYEALSGSHPGWDVYKKNEIPERLHYRNHWRIPTIVGILDEAWSVTSKAYADSRPDAFEGGAHGYDPAYTSMHGIFIAYGPAFKENVTVPSFRNIHLYEMMCHILELTPASNDGSLDSVRAVFKN